METNRGVAERAVDTTRINKSPIKGLTLLRGYREAGARTSRRKGNLSGAPSATILLFGQLSGHMNWLPV